MDRRSFLLSSTALLALGNCTVVFDKQDAFERSKHCNTANLAKAKELTVDIHCHLLNTTDTNGPAFVARHMMNIPEDGVTRDLLNFASRFLPNVKREKSRLIDILKDWSNHEDKTPDQNMREDLCIPAYARHKYPLGKILQNLHFEGFLSSRIKNAADLMMTFPEVHMFVPSMVDFYEGTGRDANAGYDPIEAVRFYSALNLATNGRFLPMVSFSPERQYDEEIYGQATDGLNHKRPLDLIRWAIEELGFVGVKLHPSTGFSPIENQKYACLNTEDQKADIHPPPADEVQRRFIRYDEIMMELFLLCAELDVPILTHGSRGIMANDFCMTHKRPGNAQGAPFTYHPLDKDNMWVDEVELEWTNSPKTWIKAMKAAQKAIAAHPDLNGRTLRVCLGHLAGGFKRRPNRVGKPEYQGHKVETHPVSKTEWLTCMIDKLGKTPGLYFDLSNQGYLFEDLDPTSPARSPKMYPNARAAFGALSAEPGFAQRAMYGTDWHMPGPSKVSGSYQAEIRRALYPYARSGAMGENALRFLGLNSGGTTRARLEQFYARPPGAIFDTDVNAADRYEMAVNLAAVPWWNASGGIP